MEKIKEINRIGPFWNALFTAVLLCCTIFVIAPLALMIIISFTSQASIDAIGYSYVPLEWSTQAYDYLFKMGDQLVRSYAVTIANSVLGTVLCVLFTSMYAYVLVQRDFPLKKFFTWFVYFTNLFGAGLVPCYMINIKYYHLKDTFTILLVYGLVVPTWIIMLRAFIRTSVPDALFDAAKIDGAGHGRLYMEIIMPLLKPGLATIGLFSFVRRWNEWFPGMLYNKSPELIPLQTLLTQMQNMIQFMRSNSKFASTPDGREMLKTLPGDSMMMACLVVVIAPVLFTYPFFQKYFVKGLTVGSVKD